MVPLGRVVQRGADVDDEATHCLPAPRTPTATLAAATAAAVAGVVPSGGAAAQSEVRPGGGAHAEGAHGVDVEHCSTEPQGGKGGKESG